MSDEGDDAVVGVERADDDEFESLALFSFTELLVLSPFTRTTVICSYRSSELIVSTIGLSDVANGFWIVMIAGAKFVGMCKVFCVPCETCGN